MKNMGGLREEVKSSTTFSLSSQGDEGLLRPT